MKKVCKKCGRNRRIGKFGKLSANTDKKNKYCRDCMRAMTRRYKSSAIGMVKQKKSEKKYKNNNKEKISNYNREYYIKNRDRILYNKKSREETECILISSNDKKYDEKQVKKNINKDREKCIVINPKRK